MRVSVTLEQHGPIWCYQIMSSVHFKGRYLWGMQRYFCVGWGGEGVSWWWRVGLHPPPQIIFLKKEYKSLHKLSMGNWLIGICKVKHLKKFLSVFGEHIFSREGGWARAALSHSESSGFLIAKRRPKRSQSERERERGCDFGEFASKISNLFKYNN
jgi:hypothetical protein